jgi:hypothetical protein
MMHTNQLHHTNYTKQETNVKSGPIAISPARQEIGGPIEEIQESLGMTAMGRRC